MPCSVKIRITMPKRDLTCTFIGLGISNQPSAIITNIDESQSGFR